MKAIVTKYLGPTNSRPSRIKASAEGVPSITVPYQHGDSDGGHHFAAYTLADKYAWLGNDQYELVAGGLPDGSVAHVLIPSQQY